MATRQIEFTAGGETWYLNTLSATKGVEVFSKLTRIIGENFSSVEDTQEVAVILKCIGHPEALSLVKEVLGGLKKATGNSGMTKVEFDDEFSGRYATLAVVVLGALKGNFREDFLAQGGLEGILKQAAEA